MTQENYEVLLWVLGDRVALFNMICLAVILAWSITSLVYRACIRLLRYVDYKWDSEFWTEFLPE